jgi:micrococcal nuclease
MLCRFSTYRIASSLALSLIFASLIGSISQIAASPRSKRTINGVVVSVGDGDTFRLKDSGKVLTIRLACIDAPETRQKPYGAAATNRLRQLLPIGQPVTVKVVNTDRYARTVAKVYSGNTSINLVLVEEGYAAVYPQYLKSCPELRDRLLSAEARAKSRRLGFWDQQSPIMPWDYRRSR